MHADSHCKVTVDVCVAARRFAGLDGAANILHALAAIHGEQAGPQLVPAPLPGTVVPSVVDRVLRSGSAWESHPQLLASVAVSCAQLRQRSAPLFSLVGRTVRAAGTSTLSKQGLSDLLGAFAVRAAGTSTLSKQGLSDLLGAFAVVGLFDLDVFSWALGQLNSGGLTSVPLDCLMSTLAALDYANQEGGQAGSSSMPAVTMLFPQCPEPFRLEVQSFYERLGLSMLTQSRQLQAPLLEETAMAFARAGLIDAVPPFDLLSPSSRAMLK
ncbi:unnamed protein product, partial [Polarella glacialis]